MTESTDSGTTSDARSSLPEGPPPGAEGTPGRDLDTAGFDTSLGDESTGGAAAEQAVGASEGDTEAPAPTEDDTSGS